jgi:hypothetical protein
MKCTRDAVVSASVPRAPAEALLNVGGAVP